MKKVILLAAVSATLVACSTSQTKNNDPWAKIDQEKAIEETARQSRVAECSMSSTKMKQTMTYSVWLPREYDESKTYPFLYLLHGYEYGDQSRLDRCWLDKGDAARIADEYQKSGGDPMVIVMPNGQSSFYIGDYEEYFHQELMPKVEADFHCNGKRAISGLSMGGYGTLYHALKYPSKFKYAYAMSPAADVSMAAMVSDASILPGITVETGEQDPTTKLQDIKPFVEALQKKGCQVDFIVRDGVHNWVFWKACLPKALRAAADSFK